jgi:hypothetical protein
MKRRYLYALIFCIPAFLLTLIICVGLFAAVFGLLWIFVFGDDTWPQGIDLFLVIPLILVFAGIWITLLTVAYKAGKAHEADLNSSPKKALSMALTATALLIFFIALHQWQVGNIGPKSDSILCSDFCRDKGYSASMTSARNASDANCTCYDAHGKVTIKAPLTTLRANGDSN